jgi:glycine/D-amino acid oxidase-like deaminating enzyme
MSTPPQEPTEEELRAALEEQLRQLQVEDVLLQTVVTLVNLAGRRLTAEGEKDAEQARVAIEAVRALLPLCPQEELKPVRDALSQLQMLYVRETQGAAPPPPEEPPPPKPHIWTPPGS